MDETLEIIIHIEDGEVVVVKKPLGVVLKIVDFDTADPDGRVELWSEMDMTREE